MLHTKTFMFALITAGCLAAPAASAGYPPPPYHPHPDKHSCDDIKLKELDAEVRANGKVEANGKIKGLEKNEKAKVTFKALGTAELKCRTNGGAFPGPHQKGEVDVKVSGWQKVEADKYGKADFHIVTDKPETSKMCKKPFTPVLRDLEYNPLKVIIETGECTVKFVCDLDDPLTIDDPVTLDPEEDCMRVDD